MPEDCKPLRILGVVNLPLDGRLGAARVWIELAQEWRAAGNIVEIYSLSDAFPEEAAPRAMRAIRQVLFARKAAAFVRASGARFDVVDALIGTLPFTKRSLRFAGLLVARSVGLYSLYEEFERSVEKRWPGRPKGKIVGRIFYTLTRREWLRASQKSVRFAELINVPNEGERLHLREKSGVRQAIIVQPNGLTDKRLEALRDNAKPARARLAQQKICFIGMWSARKGALDWARIVQRVRERIPQAKFSFLGTMVNQETVMRDLAPVSREGLEFVSHYEPDDLPKLLADCTVGAFPSYVEGFGLAVVEQIAAGIPTVAYDTAGPHDILASGLGDLLVPSGDVEAFAEAICRILQLDLFAYEKLSQLSIEVSREFSWTAIAKSTLDCYREQLLTAGATSQVSIA